MTLNISSNPTTSAIGNGGAAGGATIIRTEIMLLVSKSNAISVGVALAPFPYQINLAVVCMQVAVCTESNRQPIRLRITSL